MEIKYTSYAFVRARIGAVGGNIPHVYVFMSLGNSVKISLREECHTESQTQA